MRTKDSILENLIGSTVNISLQHSAVYYDSCFAILDLTVPGSADKSADYLGVQFLLYSHVQWCLLYVVLSDNSYFW